MVEQSAVNRLVVGSNPTRRAGRGKERGCFVQPRSFSNFLCYTFFMNSDERITAIGYTDYRNKKAKFGIKNKDRLRHVYVIGKTGMGKSTLLENMAAQDILHGEGMCFIDPHGSAIDTLLEYIPEHRVNDVVYFAPFDTKYPISFNILEKVHPDERHLVVSGLMATFEKIWPDTFSERMKYILSNTLLALLEYPGATLLGVNRMLADKDYRKDVIDHITDSSVKAFWVDEFNKWDPRYAREASAAIQNKIGQFTSNPLIRNIIGQEESSFNIRKLMDEKKVFLVNLSKGQIGESNANLLGGMLVTKLTLAAMSRADISSSKMKSVPPFFLFVDEFQNFANRSFADILSEARKYKLGLTIAHQYIDQMQEEVAAAVFGNVETIITFRIGASDAEILEKQFAPVFTAEDFVNLGRFQIYLTLMIDGIGSRPFSASTLPPLPKPAVSLRNEVIANSRYWYAKKREEVEEQIRIWYDTSFKKVEKRSFPEKTKQEGKKSAELKKKKISSSSKNSEKNSVSLQKTPPPEEKMDKKEIKNSFDEMNEIISPKLEKLIDQLVTEEKEEKILLPRKQMKQSKKKARVERSAASETKKLLSSVVSQVIKKTPEKQKENKKGKGGGYTKGARPKKGIPGLEDILLED